MASLDEGSVGCKVLAGLPDANGLPAIAADLLDTPRPVYAIVELRPAREVHNIDADSHTVVLRLTQIEPLSGGAADALRDQLDAVREKRTGSIRLPGIDGAEVPEVVAPEALNGPGDWTDEELAAAERERAEDEKSVPAQAVPPFTSPFAEPTPIAGRKTKKA